MIEQRTIDPGLSREDILRHGEPRDVIEKLSALNGELRLALQNALERIADLERRLNSIRMDCFDYD